MSTHIAQFHICDQRSQAEQHIHGHYPPTHHSLLLLRTTLIFSLFLGQDNLLTGNSSYPAQSLTSLLVKDDSYNAVVWESNKSFPFTKDELSSSSGQGTGFVVLSSWVTAASGMSITVLGHESNIVGERKMAVHFYGCEFLHSVEKWHNWVENARYNF